MTQITTRTWKDYELLDTGNGRKLERFGSILLSRPAPQALWPPMSGPDIWSQSQGIYHRSNTGGGQWEFPGHIPESWIIRWNNLEIQVKPTGFGHLGVFPEQAFFWNWIADQVRKTPFQMNILNLFAYTGYSTLAAAEAGAKVTHVDGAKSAVTWAGENAERNGLKSKPIRWIADDVTKFVGREVRRGVKYDAIIMDPPSFGRGPKGEVWKIEQDLLPLLGSFRDVMSDRFRFFLFTCHSQHVSPPGVVNLMDALLRNLPTVHCHLDSGDIVIESKHPGTSLPSGVYGYAETTC
ncbi:class I SAM-dependent methyltransferase [bacterium]|nr:class I SAM-dependent methyltransferase [candidate division CSSED10-310 bacterium]